MQELEVSVGRSTYPLTPPFFVVATQNPVEQEGTYPLPEAQLDRFMFNIPVTYPTPEEEAEIVKSTTSNVSGTRRADSLRRRSRAAADARPRRAGGERRGRTLPSRSPATRGRKSVEQRSRTTCIGFIRYGASPRASQYLILGAKARALLHGPVPRRFRRRAGRCRARAAASAGAQFPRPGGRGRCRRDHPPHSGQRPQSVTGAMSLASIIPAPRSSPSRSRFASWSIRELLASVEDLDLVARWVVEGFLHGLHRSPYVGFSVDFASHREYMPGDDLRHLNWKLYGRARPAVHQAVRRRDERRSAPGARCQRLDDGRRRRSSRNCATRRCSRASLAHLASRQRDAVGLTLCRRERDRALSTPAAIPITSCRSSRPWPGRAIASAGRVRRASCTKRPS